MLLFVASLVVVVVGAPCEKDEDDSAASVAVCVAPLAKTVLDVRAYRLSASLSKT